MQVQKKTTASVGQTASRSFIAAFGCVAAGLDAPSSSSLAPRRGEGKTRARSFEGRHRRKAECLARDSAAPAGGSEPPDSYRAATR